MKDRLTVLLAKVRKGKLRVGESQELWRLIAEVNSKEEPQQNKVASKHPANHPVRIVQ